MREPSVSVSNKFTRSLTYTHSTLHNRAYCDRPLEKVQRRFTKWLPGFKSYIWSGQRLKRVSLPTLELRRLHGDLVMCYKMVFGFVKLSFADFFAFNPVTVTRGHQYKLYVNHSRGIRKHFLC